MFSHPGWVMVIWREARLLPCPVCSERETCEEMLPLGFRGHFTFSVGCNCQHWGHSQLPVEEVLRLATKRRRDACYQDRNTASPFPPNGTPCLSGGSGGLEPEAKYYSLHMRANTAANRYAPGLPAEKEGRTGPQTTG